MGRLKMQDWKMMDENAGLENARLENGGRKCTAGKWGTRTEVRFVVDW